MHPEKKVLCLLLDLLFSGNIMFDLTKKPLGYDCLELILESVRVDPRLEDLFQRVQFYLPEIGLCDLEGLKFVGSVDDLCVSSPKLIEHLIFVLDEVML